MITLTLSCDHRVVDGARAAEFMRDLAAAITSPQG
jgi:pyruvate/2-oxoglutarate dehydrogenase complex dihydrolipoamide acyltransferase (E2) component